MASARLGKELLVKTANKTGMLAEVTSAIASAGVNIVTICAYGQKEDAYFMLVTENNKKAGDALKPKGYEITERDVVIVELKNRPGAAKEMADKLKSANIDLKYIYGTTHGSGAATIVFASENNAEAIKVVI